MIFFLPRLITSKKAQWLEMNTAHCRHLFQRKLQNFSYLIFVDSFRNDRNKHDAKICFFAVLNRLFLDVQHFSSAQNLIGILTHTVKLQKYTIQPCRLQSCCIVRLLRQTNSIRIQLEKGKSLFFSKADNILQIVAHRRLTTGKLDIERTAAGHHGIIPFPNLLKRRLFHLIALPRSCKADRTVEVASIRHFQKDTTGMLPVLRTESAIIRTAFFHLHRRIFLHRRHLLIFPALIIRCSFPD